MTKELSEMFATTYRSKLHANKFRINKPTFNRQLSIHLKLIDDSLRRMHEFKDIDFDIMSPFFIILINSTFYFSHDF